MRSRLVLFCILLSFNILYSQGTYYDNISTSNVTFVEDLKNRIRTPYTWVPYSQHDETNIANFASYENLDGTRSVFCVYSNYEHIYSGTFAWLPLSREHTFPHSWMPTNPANDPERDEYADQHHLFPTHQDNANAVRSNHPLGNVTTITSSFGDAKFGTDVSGNTVYEPRDQHKGDAARAILYMIIRYDDIDGYDWGLNAVNAASTRDPQDINVLLNWHAQDPPDQWEIDRNDYTETIQGNRNPFVDHPEYVNFIEFGEVEYNASGLYFTEYIEGSSDNKALEIFNSTGSTINLSTDGYKIEIYANGSATATSTITLSGSVVDADVFVISHSAANATILGETDQTSSSLSFSGNDAIVLKKGTDIIDVIGQTGFDPGTEWGTGLVSTADNTIRRNSSIGVGDSDGSDVFDPSLEWNGFSTDTFDGLGSHVVNMGPPTISSFLRSPQIPTAVENTTVSANVTDDGVVGVVKIIYTIDGGSEEEVTMTNISGSSYQGVIPNSTYGDGDLLECWIYAEDSEGSQTTSTMQNVFTGTTPIVKLHENNTDGGLEHIQTYARILGVATVATGSFSSSSIDVNIQDATQGITIYKGGSSAIVARGNNYTITGKLDQYNGKTELIPDNNTDVVDLGVGILPEPLILSINELLLNPESYEGTLVKIQQLSNTGSSWPTAGNNANFNVSDDGGSTVLTLRIDKDTDIDGSSEPTWPIDITGIFSQFDYAAPYTWGYQIQPRDLLDFTNSVSVQLTTMLEGPYNSASDEMDFLINGSIPKISPFIENPRTIINIPTDIVDWVLVELRSTLNGSAVVSHSALLHKDGRIVADDGTNTIRLTAAPGLYYIVVKHRNHLSVMSSQAINLTGD